MKGIDPQWEANYLQRQVQINGYARECFQPRLKVVEKILVYPPGEHLRYLQHHPCGGCQAECCCDTPCLVYLQWYNARLEAARIRAKQAGAH